MALLYRSTVIGPLPVGRSPAAAVRRGGLRSASVGFAFGVAGLALVTPLLVLAADAVSVEAGVTATLVGTLLVGLSISLPELAATVSAVRLGALDLAVGNVFGSVAFNMVVFVVLDAVYLPGPLPSALSRDHLLSVQLLVICLALGIMGILSRARRRPGSATIESALIIAAYLVGAWLLSGLGRR